MSAPGRRGRPLLALSAPLLILLGLISMLARNGVQRLQALPAVLIGSGLLVSSGLKRGRHRRGVLEALIAKEPPSSGG